MTDNSSERVRAVRIHEPGGIEVLKLEEIAIPRPGPDEALVRVQAAGLNFIDIYRRRGTYPVDLPYTPGLEASGVVQEVGSAVTEVKPGDR
ncbi:MAG: alcohol dehydrogenase catalytic domain-containing protein, partial [Cyanobacteria bacterium]|nr:alcohol dehydrogenase catalytic domain-containing protein [Cyanobacteriota bacterium]